MLMSVHICSTLDHMFNNFPIQHGTNFFTRNIKMNNNIQDQCLSCLLAQIVGITYLHPCFGDLYRV